jgi:hypothetical protein
MIKSYKLLKMTVLTTYILFNSIQSHANQTKTIKKILNYTAITTLGAISIGSGTISTYAFYMVTGSRDKQTTIILSTIVGFFALPAYISGKITYNFLHNNDRTSN